MKTLREAALLLVLAVMPALATGLFHPKRPAWSSHAEELPRATISQAQSWGAVVLWVDARSFETYQTGRIPGAVSLTMRDWERQLPEFLQAWTPDRKVIVYCDGGSCQASEEVALRLKRELGLEDVTVLQEGWDAWRRAAR